MTEAALLGDQILLLVSPSSMDVVCQPWYHGININFIDEIIFIVSLEGCLKSHGL